MTRRGWRRFGLVLVAIGLSLPATASAASGDDDIERGRGLVETNCARCHAVGESGESPFQPAPPFRTLHENYPLEDLEEALAEGIVSGHPAMPEFSFDPDQIDAIIAYLKSLH